MTKRIKRLTAAALAVAVLGGIYAVLLTHPQTDDEDNETVALTSVETEDVAEIAIQLCDGDSYAVACSSDDSGTSYTMNGGDEDGVYDENSLSSLLSTAAAISGQLVEPACQELDKYELDEGNSVDVVTVTQTDGSKTVLQFGLTSETLGGTYCREEENTDVYFVSDSIVSTLLQEQKQYLSMQVLTAYYTLSTDLQALTLRRDGETAFALERRDTSGMDEDVSSAYSDFVITEPERCDADDSALNAGILGELQSGLTADTVLKAEAKQYHLEKYGLDSPKAEITLEFDNEEQTLLIGDTDEDSGLTAVMTSDGDTIFGCGSDYFSFVQEDDWAQYRSAHLLAFAKSELDQAVLTEGNDKHTVDFTYVPADENEDEDADTIQAKLDGEELDDEGIDKLYVALTTMKAVSEVDGTTDDTPVLTLTIRLTDGTKHTLALCKGGSREYIANVDGGGYRFTVSQTDVDTLRSAFGEK